MDISASALLEWVDSLEAAEGRRVQSLDDLRDGGILLEAMHDVSPEVFPAPGTGAAPLRLLLDGLGEHFQGRRGRGEACARQLLEQEVGGAEPVDISLLVQLVIWATLDNDLSGPRQQSYIDLCQGLSDFSKEAIMDIAQRFGEAESPTGHGLPPPTRSADLAFSPPARGPASDELPDFMEVGLDDETRYRRLKKRYHMVMEEQERLEDERNLLRRQLETETKKCQDAEEGEKMARAELRESDEARHRMKEENRALFEVRLEQEAQKFREQLKQRDKQIETMREERDLARVQAGKAERLTEQLTLCKKKLEESQVWKREKEELKRQLDDAVSSKSSGSGGTDHMRIMLNRTRQEADVLLEERDEAQRQAQQLQQELAQMREEQAAAREELAVLRRGEGSKDAAQRGTSGAAAAAEPSGPRSPTGASVEELRGLLHSQKDDLLERLLVEKERATRAETTLQLKQAETASLTQQRARDAETIAGLEEKSRAQADRLAELERKGQGGEDAGGSREQQAALAQCRRELQIHRWRSQAESDALMAQETLMASCFHELGLKYHKLLLQNETLAQRLQDQTRPSSVDPGMSPDREAALSSLAERARSM